MRLFRRTLLAGAVASGALFGVSHPIHAADMAAAAPVTALNQAITSAMRAGKSASFMQRYNILLPAVQQAFDLHGVLEASVGPRLATLPSDQQAKLLDVFTKFTVASYASNFDSDEGEKLRVLPEQRAVGADVIVESEIVPTSGDSVRIDYQMRKGPQGWKAVDVLLNGSISQNAVKRSDFRSLVTATSAQPLIESLQRKVSELSLGALS